MNRGGTSRRGRPRGGRAGRPASRQSQADGESTAAHSGTNEAPSTTVEAPPTEAAPSDSIPAPTSNPVPSLEAESQPAATAGSAPKPTGTTRGTRFRPKNVRRNEEDRVRIAQEEAKKDSERMAEERRRQGKSNFRGRRGRGGRGTPFGAPNIRPSPKVEAPGVSQQQSASGRPPPPPPHSTSTRGTNEFSTRGGHRPNSKNTFATVTLAEYGEHSTPKINADLFCRDLWSSDLPEEDQRALEYIQSRSGPLPRGIRRRQYYEETKNDEDGAHVAVPETNTPSEQSRSSRATTDAGTIKTEEGEESNVVVDAMGVEPQGNNAQGRPMTLNEKFQRESSEFLLQTFAQGLNNGESKPYLFRMLPKRLMPQLRPGPPPGPRIKGEDEDMVMLDPEQIDLTKNDEQTGEAEKEIDDYYADYDGEDKYKYGGFVGKLVIRKSGKAELDWGGIKMELCKGSDYGGVLSYMVTEDDESKDAETTEGYVGKAIGMGQLLGKIDVSTAPHPRKDPLEITPEELQRIVDEAITKQAEKEAAKKRARA